MPEDEDQLAAWIEASYEACFRTACLIVGNRSDAEEAVQEAFLRAWRFRRSLESASQATPWLYRVVVNSCHSKLRQEIPRRDRRGHESALDGVASPEPDPAQMAIGNERAESVHQALLELPLHLRTVVVLRYYADLSERDIARAIGRRPGTVKSRLHEARGRLAQMPGLRALGEREGTRPAGDTPDTQEAAR
ncbi:MAG: RNA polymerase sigma factor [Acidimicrobiales bacterium]